LPSLFSILLYLCSSFLSSPSSSHPLFFSSPLLALLSLSLIYSLCPYPFLSPPLSPSLSPSPLILPSLLLNYISNPDPNLYLFFNSPPYPFLIFIICSLIISLYLHSLPLYFTIS
jgi:hypothetical protein